MPVEVVDKQVQMVVQGDIDTCAFSDSLLILTGVIGDFFYPQLF